MKPAVLLGCLLLVACSKEAPAPEPVRPVLSTLVSAQNQAQLGRFAGDIEARYQSSLGFRVNGRIARRVVDVGAQVQAGDLLAVLDPTDQQNRLRSSQGDLARVEAQYVNAQANARRQQELFDQGVGAQAGLDIALTDLKTAQASRDQAQAAVGQSRDQLSYSELRADHAAVVTEWRAEAGQTVTAGQAVVTLARPDVKEAVIDLPAELAGRLPVGVNMQVAAQLDPSVQSTGTVREIEPQADSSTRTRRARLTLADTPDGFRLGTAISVTLSSAIPSQIELPLTSLLDDHGKTQVWVVDPRALTVATREVQVISRGTERALIGAGVQPGERVVTAGVHSLKPGQKVKVDEERTQ